MYIYIHLFRVEMCVQRLQLQNSKKESVNLRSLKISVLELAEIRKKV